MKINGINYLLLERRGCNYFPGDGFAKKSDVGNYRVFVRFTDKSGVDVCGDFQSGYVYDHSKKKPVIVNDNVLSANLQFENERGCFGYRPSEDPRKYTYNIADILSFVNSISQEHYDAIKWIEEIDVTIPAGSNFTPSGLIYKWAKENRVEVENTRYFEQIVKLYTGNYKYLAYSVTNVDQSVDKVTIILEEA